MLQRRTFLSGVACAGMGASVLCIGSAHAQRATHPIARPPGLNPDGSIMRGRLGGVASGTVPGVFSVVAVNTQAGTLQLRDDSGETAVVQVDPDRLDLSSLNAGDEVQVDFLVPQPGAAKLEVGNLWKVQR